MDFAAQNNVHLNCGDIELSNMQEEKFDLYYTFSVEVFFSEALNGEDYNAPHCQDTKLKILS